MNDTEALTMGKTTVKTSPYRTALYSVFRVLCLVSVVAAFYPGLNPGRITESISRNLSLFTETISYSSLTSNLTRALMRGWVDSSTFVVLQIMCAILIVGIVLAAVGGCMSFGNRRMRYYGLLAPLAGGIAMSGGLIGIYMGYINLVSAANAKVPAMLPKAFWFYVVLTAGILICTVLAFIEERQDMAAMEEKMELPEKYQLFLLLLPVLMLSFLFSYLPLWGWRYAFFDYTPGGTLSAENFVGLKWFTILFQNEATRNDLMRVLKNTLGMSAIGILTSWLPMVFAIFLTQVKSKRFRRFVQTFTTVPNFLGWVIVYAVALAIFSTDGFINNFLNNILGMSSDTNYLMSDSHMWLKMWLWGTWKGVGWSAIVYISSISGIDPGLYEAAEIDGAGRFHQMWDVTVPALLPTFFVLLLMSIANILSNGMDQYLVFSNAINAKSIEVLDLYVYNLGIGSGQIPMSTAIGMFKSVISVALLFGANFVSKKLRGESIL